MFVKGKIKYFVETRDLLYFNNKYVRMRKFRIKRYYNCGAIYFSKDKKIIELIGITGLKIIDILKIGSKNKLNKSEKLFKHKGGVIKSKFIDEDNVLKVGFIPLTKQDKYQIKMENNIIETSQSISLDKNQNLSTEILLLKGKDVDIEKLDNNYDEKMNKKYKIKIENKFNEFINKNNGILLIQKDGIKDQKVSKNKIEKLIKQDNELNVYKIKKID